ncbi:MAG: efflux transporter outer membrane subunit [Candidatus Andeanibacterium colombiense]|uniref:Efflux transporter outer membrane subunit n=1 Tax=Candidatus Andeanibacterium colombiense TaxID=3121345 RepID=A0AAJ6BMY8_9SPHN|nr:MAG: efflux transporter outer membrane subunit [Sphingomonadaceae bacterium]
MRTIGKSLVLPALLSLGACTVGLDYAGPPAVGSAAPPGNFVRADATTTTGEPGLAEWWTVLGDNTLDELERRAIAGSPDLAVARARLDQARAALRVERTKSTPQVSAMGVAADIRIPDLDTGTSSSDPGAETDSGATNTTFYNLGLNAIWEIDLFGGQRRSNEASRAEAEGAEANVADAQVSLTAAVAQAYLGYRDRQARIVLAQGAIERRAALLDLQSQRQDRGAGTLSDVEQARADLEQANQALAPLKAEADGFANALAILMGEAPGAADTLLTAPADMPLPPASVAVGDPAALLRNRPDIRAAERRLAAETARIGVAEAARLPRLSFLGILGVGGTSPSDLTHLDDFTAIGAPMLQWNILDFGKGKATIDQAQARRDEATANYRGTVLGALRDVENALADFRSARENAASQARAEQSTARLEELARQRFDRGTTPKTTLLEAELAHAAAQDALAQARANLLGRFVALEKALGLGWTNAAPAN